MGGTRSPPVGVGDHWSPKSQSGEYQGCGSEAQDKQPSDIVPSHRHLQRANKFLTERYWARLGQDNLEVSNAKHERHDNDQ